MQTKLLLVLGLLAVLSHAQSNVTIIRLPLTLNYFNATNNVTTQNDGFLSDVQNISVDRTDNTFYTVSVNIGSGNSPFRLVIDTAESITFVATYNLESNTTNHFDCNTSQTCDASNYLFPIGYDDGETIRASYITDTIDLGNNVTVQQGFVLFNHNISFLDNPADGVLGLQRPYTFLGIDVDIEPIVDNLSDQGKINQKAFSIFLANITNTTNNTNSSQLATNQTQNATNGTNSTNSTNSTNTTEQSWLILGGYDPLLMTTSDFNYYNLIDDDDWMIAVEFVQFLGNQYNTSGQVLFDSRAGSTQAPQDAFNTILGWAQSWNPSCASANIGSVTTIQCTCSSALYNLNSTLSFAFSTTDGQLYNITSNQLIKTYGDVCFLNINQGGDSNDDWVLSHDFMINYYMLYDESNQTIGIAPANHTIPN